MKTAKIMINSATSLSMSQSSLIVGSMIAAKEGQVQNSVNYWHKGKCALLKKRIFCSPSLSPSSTILLQLEKFMSKYEH